jgi:hypothetical protein
MNFFKENENEENEENLEKPFGRSFSTKIKTPRGVTSDEGAPLESAESGVFLNGETDDEEDDEEYNFVRSISMNIDGTINKNEFLTEMFKGYNTWETEEGKLFGFEYFAHPSTIIKKNSNVVIASQIYEREYTNEKDQYSGVSYYKEYYKKLKEIQQIKAKDKRFITWLGAPSIVYSYKNRKQLQDIFKEEKVYSPIYFFFWPTSFNSSTCIFDFTKDNSPNYCTKYKELKKFCKQEKYQAHNTYSNYLKDQNSKNYSNKFTTDLNKALDIISEEHGYINIYNEENDTDFFQRYNETFTYFFPWDIVGIEIGNVKQEILTDFYNSVFEARKQFVTDLYILKNKENLIKLINDNISLINNSNIKYIHEILSEFTLFLLSKYILMSLCHSKRKLLQLKENEKENVIELINIIIEIMNVQLNVYEYKLQNNTFSLEKKTQLEPRSSDFVLFEQKLDSNTNITNVFKSELQLINDDKDLSTLLPRSQSFTTNIGSMRPPIGLPSYRSLTSNNKLMGQLTGLQRSRSFTSNNGVMGQLTELQRSRSLPTRGGKAKTQKLFFNYQTRKIKSKKTKRRSSKNNKTYHST